MDVYKAGKFVKSTSAVAQRCRHTDLIAPHFKFLACLAVFLVVTLLYWLESRHLTIQVDDAYITYQYSQNLADGLGAVFNPGERVEGYSNLLWMLVIAGGISSGWPAEVFSHYLSLFSGLGLLLASGWYAFTILPASYRYLAFLAPLLVYASNPFIAWTTSGLETPSFAALILAALAAQNAGYQKWTICFTVLTLLSRPDGVLLPAALILTSAVNSIADGRSVISRDIIGQGLIYFFVLVALTLFRLVYYGDYVPNTFHAKVGSVDWSYGVNYIGRFLKDGAMFLVPPFVVAAFVARRLLSGIVFSALLLVYIVYIGGDHFHHSRFLLPLVPILAAGSFYCVALLLQTKKVALILLATVSVLMMPLWSLFAPRDTLVRSQIYEGWHPKRMLTYPKATVAEGANRDIIAAIKNLRPEVKLIAAVGIGQIRFWSGIPVLDLLGLTDRTIGQTVMPDTKQRLIGHVKSNAKYVFQRRPDVILIPRKNSPIFILLPAIGDLWKDPELDQQYRWNDSIHGYVLKGLEQRPTIDG
jgi:arabinofuranosyltransferase